MQKQSKLYSIFNGAVILTLAGLFTKILSATYRIPYHHIAGDIGFYIYQQVYPLYGIALQLGTYGFPVIISKLVAEYAVTNRRKEIRGILQVSFAFLFIVGCTIFAFEYIFAETIAEWMGDRKLTVLIQIISFSFLLIPFIAVIRGYYQGLHNMFPTALSQIAEQVVRVGTILYLSIFLIQHGYDLYTAGAGAIFGSITGGITSLVILFLFVFRTKTNSKGVFQRIKKADIKRIFKILVIQGLLICISGMGLLFIQLIDSFTLYSSLTAHGMAEEAAQILKGIYDRGLPLIQLGTVVGTAFSLSLVPVISSAIAKKNLSFVVEKVQLSLRLSLVVGVGAAFGLIALMKPINMLLYGDSHGTDVLQILSLLVIFTTVAATAGAVLQGMGAVFAPVIAVIAGMAVKLILNLWLIPDFQTIGAAIASSTGFAIVAAINLFCLYKKLAVLLVPKKASGGIFITGIAMFVLLQSYLFCLHHFAWSNGLDTSKQVVETGAGVLIGSLFYLFIIMKQNIFTEEELRLLPMGSVLAKYVLKNKLRR
ncbi:oligosaccharide flippase family protein [Priestia megaterium]|uniref:putative polysaccharide biosynthesis protein n=1 Tax=Priestia megaterium TaxID=1404 RepID=UPI00366DA5CA